MSEVLTSGEAADFLKVKEQTLRKWRRLGKGPKFHRLGEGESGHVRYLASDLMEYLKGSIEAK